VVFGRLLVSWKCTKSSLDKADKPRLIILDQFEKLLDWQTGFALPDRPGIGELLDTLNSKSCRCRILLTSRPVPRGTHDYAHTHMEEYLVEGLDTQEGAELIRNQGVLKKQAADAELANSVKRCDGHALSIILLASILLHNPSLRLSTLLENLSYSQEWKDVIADKLLDYIYKQQLDEETRKWLVAFAVYRLPATIDAAKSVMGSNDENTASADITTIQGLRAVNALLAQHLLQASGSGSELYQLHAIVSEYAKDHINTKSPQLNRKALRALHTKAANYFMSCTKTNYIPLDQRKGIDHVKLLIEAVWQYCQAGQWQEAFNFMRQENLFTDLSRWGNNAVLLELCQLLLPSREWMPERPDEVYLFETLGRICDELEAREQSFEYYKQALKVQREINDHKGEGKTLHSIGMLFLKRGSLAYGFACIRLALYIFETIKSATDCDNEKYILQEIHTAAGEKEYLTLTATIEPQTYQVVEQALRTGLQ
jgi:hypothetical protein